MRRRKDNRVRIEGVSRVAQRDESLKTVQYLGDGAIQAVGGV